MNLVKTTIKNLLVLEPKVFEDHVSREITKKFEEHVRGSLVEVIKHFEKKEPKGEFVIILEGKKE